MPKYNKAANYHQNRVFVNEPGDVSYYSTQLSRLKDFTEVNIKFIDYDGNSTNNMNLNNESIDIIIEFLKELKINPENFNNRKKEV